MYFTVDGTLIAVNEAAGRRLGRGAGQSFMPAISPEEQERVRQSLRTYTPERPVRFRVVEVDGRRVRWVVRAMFDEFGAVRAFEGVGWVIDRDHRILGRESGD